MSSISKKPLVKQRTVYDERGSKSNSHKRVSFDASGSDEENSQGRYNREPYGKKKSGDDDLLDLFRSGKGASESDDDDIVIGGKTSDGKTRKGQPKPAPRHTRSELSSPKSTLDSEKPSAPQRHKPSVSSRSSKQHSLDYDDVSTSKGKPKPAPRTSPREQSRSYQGKSESVTRRTSSFEEGKDLRLGRNERHGDKAHVANRKGSFSRTKSLEDSDDDDEVIGKTRFDSKQTNNTTRSSSHTQKGKGSSDSNSKRTSRNELIDDDDEDYRKGMSSVQSRNGRTVKGSEGRPVKTKPGSRVWNESDESEEETVERRKATPGRSRTEDRNYHSKGDDYTEEAARNRKDKPIAPSRSPRARNNESRETVFDGTTSIRKSESIHRRGVDEGGDERSDARRQGKPVPPPRHGQKVERTSKRYTEESAEDENEVEVGGRRKPGRSMKIRVAKDELGDSSDEDEDAATKDQRFSQNGKVSQKGKEKEEEPSFFGKLKSKFASKDSEKEEDRFSSERTKDKQDGSSVFSKRASKHDKESEKGTDGERVAPVPRKGKAAVKSKLSYLEDTESDDDDDYDDDENQRHGKRMTPVPRDRTRKKGDLIDSETKSTYNEAGLSGEKRRMDSPPQPKRRTQTLAYDDGYSDEDGRRRRNQQRVHKRGLLDSDDDDDHDDDDDVENDYLDSKRKTRPGSAKYPGHAQDRGQGTKPKPSPRTKTPSSARGNVETGVTREQRPGCMKKAASYSSLPTRDLSRGVRQGGPNDSRAQGGTMKKALTPQRPVGGKKNGKVRGAGHDGKGPGWGVTHDDMSDDDDDDDDDDHWSRQRGFQRHSNSSTPMMRGPMKAERDITEMTRSPHLRQTPLHRTDEYADDFTPRYKTQRSLGQQRSSSLTNLRTGSPASYTEESDDEDQRRLDTVTIRQTVYDNWLSRKNVKFKKELSKKALDKQREEHKAKEEREKRKSAKLAFRSWNEKKGEDLQEQQEKLKAKRKEEKEKALEKRIKEKDAQKYFESWKSKKDKELKGTYREKKTEVKSKKEHEEEEKRQKLLGSKKSFENWKSKKDEQLKQTYKDKKKQEKLEAEKKEDEEYEKTIKNADEYQKWVETKGKPPKAPPPPTLTQRAWVPGSRHTADCIPGSVHPVIQPPTPNRARTLSASNRLQTMKMYDYR